MTRLLLLVMQTATVILTTPVVAATANTSSCMAGKRAALVKGHFTGPLLCSGKAVSFVKIGRVEQGRFALYDYRYRYRPIGANVMHGGQRIILFRNGIYAGQYVLSPPPYTIVTVKGSTVIMHSPDGSPDAVLNFADGPPRNILVGGDSVRFTL
ncbi:hypothetical protein [Sphingomonas sp. GM_Shp_1]|uniref:hypothetical protein n=1 Tax=Sphingomonas sp. GM_Shp_1 TaxID=2937381 RepID=UPI00226B2206|nr:hypothetical protein [Sphingomonas sp. GM_Shp_1]